MTQPPGSVRPRPPRDRVASSGRADDTAAGRMAGRMATTPSDARQRGPGEDLLLSETNHRWSNDLQLIVGLLALQGRRAANHDVRQALNEAMERVAILSRARSALCRERQQSLTSALQQVREALYAQAELRSISISLEIEREVPGLSDRQITTMALVVNELTINAIKHAFAEEEPGHVRLSISTDGDLEVVVSVDDDGLPFAEAAHGGGMGMGLVKRLAASIGGVLILPPPGTKMFELRVPFAAG